MSKKNFFTSNDGSAVQYLNPPLQYTRTVHPLLSQPSSTLPNFFILLSSCPTYERTQKLVTSSSCTYTMHVHPLFAKISSTSSKRIFFSFQNVKIWSVHCNSCKRRDIGNRFIVTILANASLLITVYSCIKKSFDTILYQRRHHEAADHKRYLANCCATG